MVHSSVSHLSFDTFAHECKQMLIISLNPSKLEVIGRCGGDEKTNDHAEPTKVESYFFFIYISLKRFTLNCMGQILHYDQIILDFLTLTLTLGNHYNN